MLSPQGGRVLALISICVGLASLLVPVPSDVYYHKALARFLGYESPDGTAKCPLVGVFGVCQDTMPSNIQCAKGQLLFFCRGMGSKETKHMQLGVWGRL
jgi:hypothetical protein